MPGIIIDIGTGDGSFAYSLAKKYPDRMIIGVDTNQQALNRASAKTVKKPQRGGIKNSLFVLASVEELPEELRGTANQVFINFPWGSLLRGLISGNSKVWNSIRRICKKGAMIDIILGYDEGDDAATISELPALSAATIQDTAQKIKGFNLVKVKTLDSVDLKKYPSAWAKRIAFGKNKSIFYVRLKAE